MLAFAVMGVLFWLHGRLQRDRKNLAARNVAMLLAVFVLIQPVLGIEAWMRRFGAGTLPELVPSDSTLLAIRSAHHLLGTLIFTTSAALAALLYRPSLAVSLPADPPKLVPTPATTVSPATFVSGQVRQLEGSA